MTARRALAALVVCSIIGHHYHPRVELRSVQPGDFDGPAFRYWNLAGHIARHGRFYFRARCSRCWSDEPFDRTLA